MQDQRLQAVPDVELTWIAPGFLTGYGALIFPKMNVQMTISSHDKRGGMTNLIRLGGRNIIEWKEDCETFYSEKLTAEDLLKEEMIKAASEIMKLTIANIDLKDHIKQLMPVRL